MEEAENARLNSEDEAKLKAKMNESVEPEEVGLKRLNKRTSLRVLKGKTWKRKLNKSGVRASSL